jgi:serine/threonine-protein kinase
MLYEMLTGDKPYVAETPLAVIYRHANAPLPELPEHASHLQPLLHALMAKQPIDRPASAADLLGRVDDLLDRAAA